MHENNGKETQDPSLVLKIICPEKTVVAFQSFVWEWCSLYKFKPSLNNVHKGKITKQAWLRKNKTNKGLKIQDNMLQLYTRKPT